MRMSESLSLGTEVFSITWLSGGRRSHLLQRDYNAPSLGATPIVQQGRASSLAIVLRRVNCGDYREICESSYPVESLEIV